MAQTRRRADYSLEYSYGSSPVRPDLLGCEGRAAATGRAALTSSDLGSPLDGEGTAGIKALAAQLPPVTSGV